MHFTMGEGGNLPLGPDVELTLDRFTNSLPGTHLCARVPQPGHITGLLTCERGVNCEPTKRFDGAQAPSSLTQLHRFSLPPT